MKLRIRGNSLRLRLLRGEVEKFGTVGRVAETIRFGAPPDARLEYALEIDEAAQIIRAVFENNRLVVHVPESAARHWIESEEISLLGEQSLASENETLKILIEKDFVCLERRDDPDNQDAFPHPTGRCA